MSTLIQSLRDQTKSTLYKSWISQDRLNQIHHFKNVILHKPTFPNTLLETIDDHSLINPYDEKVMSFGDSVSINPTIPTIPTITSSTHRIEKDPVFFFLYNFTNYFHFLYDTLPYLYAYFFIKKFHYPDIKLLIANPETQTLYKFNSETFELLDIMKHDLVYPSSDTSIIKNTIYENLFVSTSLTYGKGYYKTCTANNKYSDESYIIWNLLVRSATERYSLRHIHSSLKCLDSNKFPKRFYVSRRSYIHGDTSNLGTNYTTRRKCINENEVVSLLEMYGISEIFCECYSMEEKIILFSNAELVIGCIGGGMCNILFSPASIQTICLDTPSFSSINKRFLHSINHTQLQFYEKVCTLAPHKLDIPLFVRVRLNDSNQIGEIESYTDDDEYLVKLSNNDVAGFAMDKIFPTIKVSRSMFEPLDEGLNSPFVCSIIHLKQILDESISKELKSKSELSIHHVV